MKNLELCLIRRRGTLYKKFKVFEIAVVRSSQGIHKQVIEKLGSFDMTYNKLVINIFRLVFWICYNVSVSYPCFKMLTEFYFFDEFNINETSK